MFLYCDSIQNMYFLERNGKHLTMKILLAEDNKKMRNKIKQILQRQIPEIKQIIECEDGNVATELYEKFQPD